MTLSIYLKHCKELARCDLGFPSEVIEYWSEEAFKKDWEAGIPPSTAVNIRFGELLGTCK